MNGARPRVLLCLLLLVVASLLPLLDMAVAHAAQITSRSLTLIAGASDGGSKPGGVVNHLFAFSLPSSANIASIKFEYCTTATGACTMPTGLDTTSATLGSDTLGSPSFSINNTTNGAPFLTRATGNSLAAGAYTAQINTVTNPTAVNGETFFVRILTYTTNDTTGTATDAGTVTAATNRQIVLTGIMPESLVFCTGESIGLTTGVPDCSTATPGSIAFDQLFSPTDTASAQSQMAASTNAGSGYSVTVNGSTLTSGLNTVTAMSPAAVGVKGTSQFGMNLKANTTATTTVARGIEVAPTANGTNYKGQATIGYNSVDNFKYASGDVVADSANGGAGGTDMQIFTISYIVNVPGSQPAGTYTTNLTYICTATF